MPQFWCALFKKAGTPTAENSRPYAHHAAGYNIKIFISDRFKDRMNNKVPTGNTELFTYLPTDIHNKILTKRHDF